MDIVIQELNEEVQNLKLVSHHDFEVDSILNVAYENKSFSYSIEKINAYAKKYPEELIHDYSEYIHNPNQTIYMALLEERIVGHIILTKHWNHLAYIEDIVVDHRFRRSGIGRKLLNQAIEWARSSGLQGIMLETQNINVNACKLYESCGFTIGGIDNSLYKGLEPQTKEIAIYWYFLFDEEDS
jgi:streptothricin acetyltransferase